MRVLGVIPARGGSKGLPRKNVLTMLDHPLIWWTVQSALNSRYLTTIVVSSDDDNILGIAGESMTYDNVTRLRLLKRPKELAQDTSKSSDVALHALESTRKDYDYVMLLEPTSPLRARCDIDAAIWRAQFEDALVSYGEVHMEHPYLVRDENMRAILDKGSAHRRQEYPKMYFPYGAIYICKTQVLRDEGTFYPENHRPYFLERWQCYEIDDMEDFICTEAILNKHLKDVLHPAHI